MSAASIPMSFRRLRCNYRAVVIIAGALALLGTFWFASRYPQLLSKAQHVGQEMPSMAYSGEVIHVASNAPLWERIPAVSANWLWSMKIGMAFGVLFGALLHTWLRYYPLKIGKNLYLNSMKGALVGAPMGVCANCAVPTACGVTRGHGRIEVALGFLFSSPNFNPVVLMMTFVALPLAMGITKYVVLLLVIVFVVPAIISWLQRDKPLPVFTVGSEGETCAISIPAADPCEEKFGSVLQELGREFGRNVWMLLKPTLTLMLLASLVSAALLTLIPWRELLSETTPLRLLLVSTISTFMPVPIALDVMFAAQLHQQGVGSGYVMVFAMTLGTYSIIPTIYLWREVSKPLAVMLFMFFVLTGWILGLVF
jgi:uncharacterized membrane protein YraQ (UPF0718 family)